MQIVLFCMLSAVCTNDFQVCIPSEGEELVSACRLIVFDQTAHVAMLSLAFFFAYIPS